MNYPNGYKLKDTKGARFDGDNFSGAAITFDMHNSNATLIECSLVDPLASDPLYRGRSQVLYAEFDCRGPIVLDGCLIDQHAANRVSQNQGIYAHDDGTPDVWIRNSIIMRASECGAQLRAGGILENCVVIDCPIGLAFGVVEGSVQRPGGVVGGITDNLFLFARDLDTRPLRCGIWVKNLTPGTVTPIQNNVFHCIGGDCIRLLGPEAALGVQIGGNVFSQSKCPHQFVGITASQALQISTTTDYTMNVTLPYAWSGPDPTTANAWLTKWTHEPRVPGEPGTAPTLAIATAWKAQDIPLLCDAIRSAYMDTTDRLGFIADLQAYLKPIWFPESKPRNWSIDIDVETGDEITIDPVGVYDHIGTQELWRRK